MRTISTERAQGLMEDAAEWNDQYEGHLRNMCIFLVKAELYSRLLRDEIMSSRMPDSRRVEYLARRKEWAGDMSIICEENILTCGKKARDLEGEANYEWHRAEGRLHGQYED